MLWSVGFGTRSLARTRSRARSLRRFRSSSSRRWTATASASLRTPLVRVRPSPSCPMLMRHCSCVMQCDRYGQTGSGKTFTMEGPPNGLADPQQRGMIPRAVDQIFADSLALQEKGPCMRAPVVNEATGSHSPRSLCLPALRLACPGWKYRMEASFVEIYNETLRDLLGNGEEKKHEIRHVEKSSTTIISDVQLGTGPTLESAPLRSPGLMCWACIVRAWRSGGPVAGPGRVAPAQGVREPRRRQDPVQRAVVALALGVYAAPQRHEPADRRKVRRRPQPDRSRRLGAPRAVGPSCGPLSLARIYAPPLMPRLCRCIRDRAQRGTASRRRRPSTRACRASPTSSLRSVRWPCGRGRGWGRGRGR